MAAGIHSVQADAVQTRQVVLGMSLSAALLLGDMQQGLSRVVGSVRGNADSAKQAINDSSRRINDIVG